MWTGRPASGFGDVPAMSLAIRGTVRLVPVCAPRVAPTVASSWMHAA